MANARITVELAGRTVTFELEGSELSHVGGASYLSNASKDFIGDEVEKALVSLVS